MRSDRFDEAARGSTATVENDGMVPPQIDFAQNDVSTLAWIARKLARSAQILPRSGHDPSDLHRVPAASSSRASCSPTCSASPTSPGSTSRLHDIDADRLAVAEGTARQVSERFGARATISTTSIGARALAGADFVINMVQVGGIDATRKDLEIPARYGLLQTIGDTTGVGGVFRALRTFPVLTGARRRHAARSARTPGS